VARNSPRGEYFGSYARPGDSFPYCNVHGNTTLWIAGVVAHLELGGDTQFERRWYGSHPEQLRALAEWLVEEQVEEVVIAYASQARTAALGGRQAAAYRRNRGALHFDGMAKISILRRQWEVSRSGYESESPANDRRSNVETNSSNGKGKRTRRDRNAS